MNINSKLAALVIAPLFAGVLIACTPGSLTPHEIEGENPYRDGFALVNVTPFTSNIPGGKMIDVWVTESVASEYAKVQLDGEGSGVDLPEGTVIVREVIGDTGEVEKLTMMMKGEPGYFPGGGDWWYGVADPDGTIRVDDDGELMQGALTQCGGCHLSRPNDGYLFGIPSANNAYH